MDKTQAKLFLKTFLKKDTPIYVNIRSVSSNGLKRKMSFYVITKTQTATCTHKTATKTKKINELKKINNHIHKLLDDYKFDKNGDLIICGAGMDMAFTVIYRLKCRLFGYKDALKYQNYYLI